MPGYNHSIFNMFPYCDRLKYLNLENNEISSVPHLRLLGARLHPEDKLDTIKDSSSKDIANKPSEGTGGGDTIKADMKMDSDAEKETQVMDEVDEILRCKLPGDESEDKPEEMQQAAARLKTHSSTLTEDPSLLGKLMSGCLGGDGGGGGLNFMENINGLTCHPNRQ